MHHVWPTSWGNPPPSWLTWTANYSAKVFQKNSLHLSKKYNTLGPEFSTKPLGTCHPWVHACMRWSSFYPYTGNHQQKRQIRSFVFGVANFPHDASGFPMRLHPRIFVFGFVQESTPPAAPLVHFFFFFLPFVVHPPTASKQAGNSSFSSGRFLNHENKHKENSIPGHSNLPTRCPRRKPPIIPYSPLSSLQLGYIGSQRKPLKP